MVMSSSHSISVVLSQVFLVPVLVPDWTPCRAGPGEPQKFEEQRGQTGQTCEESQDGLMVSTLNTTSDSLQGCFVTQFHCRYSLVSSTRIVRDGFL